MFSPAPMMRLSAIILKRDERSVLRELGRLGAVEPIQIRSGPGTVPLASHDLSTDIARCDRIKGRVDELRRSLQISSQPEAFQPTTYDLNRAEKDLADMEETASHLLNRRQKLMEQQSQLFALYEQLSDYCGFDIPLDGLDRFSFLHFVTGTMPVENVEKLQNKTDKNMVLVTLGQQKGRQTIIAMTTRMARSNLEDMLDSADFRRHDLPTKEGATIDTLCGENKREQEQVKEELERVNMELQALAVRFAPSLIEIEEAAETERRLFEMEQIFPRTESTVLLTGWVPADRRILVEECMTKSTGGRCVFEITEPEISGEENVPVLLRHSSLVRPFEMLVSTYGLPNYRELEPTLFVAISYIIMFGMMFGDMGHGAVLAGCGLTALFRGRSGKIRDFGVLLLSGGLSSIMFGLIYGSCFGLAWFKKYAIWHDPLEGDPMRLMYGAVGMGIIIISLGLILNVLNRFRRGDIIGGLFDKFGLTGLLFYWGTLTLLIGWATIRSSGLMTPAVVLFLGIPIVGWSLREPVEFLLNRGEGRHEANSGGLPGAIVESFVGAFEALLSYLANTISFVRLAAYAMSHAALLVAAFMLAAEVQKFLPGGSFWGVLIIILGNLAAIILEGIIASVQALRLEYYEFLGKFFSGNGRAFEPFLLTESARVKSR